ncbi:MAG: lipopolysaccharide assembly protein LapA domain-containing protein [Carnobacterium sp.]|uniref:Lipopolysaccharide assembly protein LapA domain-containing protein n=1 Tax=Carnobacterium antarcticum TaxID=2126436 RepID=A0ABW4NM97_9LACT|nr:MULTISPECIES: lipopolysaccharide assembly protein LapA domain-containing protein [unclassified Carnobacterium]ALV21128.1 hypothetical protein NY10_510 [Carnobacterium sp. CP1]QQP71267.1 DUF1049 domain-containing protein [Carnobacterium sp. CS13]
MKKQWGIVVAIILVLMIALFAVVNVEAVPVNFGFTMVSWPLIMVILGSLFIGALITVLIATNSAFKTKKQIKNYKDELSKIDQTKQNELDNVRMEYEQKLNDQDAKIIEQENKINSLEKELIDRMTHATPDNK